MGLIQRSDLPQTETTNPLTPQSKPTATTYIADSERKRGMSENKDGEVFMFSFSRQMLTLTHPSGTRIVFSKTNKSKMYKDSRSPNRPMLGSEVLAELERLLGDKAEAAKAMATLR